MEPWGAPHLHLCITVLIISDVFQTTYFLLPLDLVFFDDQILLNCQFPDLKNVQMLTVASRPPLQIKKGISPPNT